MEKVIRSVTTLYRLPKISHINHLRLSPTISTTTDFAHADCQSSLLNHITIRNFSLQKRPILTFTSSARCFSGKSEPSTEQPISLSKVLEHEIQEETAELSQHLSTDQFPGFSVETDDSDVKLIKQVDNATVAVRFTVSSSLNEWPTEPTDSNQQQQSESVNPSTSLVSMPEFQVQICKDNHTLELSCYFEEMDRDEETGEAYSYDPIFSIDEIVIYEGEPKETEFAVSAEYFQDDMQTGIFQYLAKYGIDDEFAKNLVAFATSYEKKQYISFMRRLKNFVSV